MIVAPGKRVYGPFPSLPRPNNFFQILIVLGVKVGILVQLGFQKGIAPLICILMEYRGAFIDQYIKVLLEQVYQHFSVHFL